MGEICELECDQSTGDVTGKSYSETLQPVVDLQPILDKLLSANVPETEAKTLLHPIEEELKRRTCGLVWKRGGGDYRSSEINGRQTTCIRFVSGNDD